MTLLSLVVTPHPGPKSFWPWPSHGRSMSMGHARLFGQDAPITSHKPPPKDAAFDRHCGLGTYYTSSDLARDPTVSEWLDARWPGPLSPPARPGEGTPTTDASFQYLPNASTNGHLTNTTTNAPTRRWSLWGRSKRRREERVLSRTSTDSFSSWEWVDERNPRTSTSRPPPSAFKAPRNARASTESAVSAVQDPGAGDGKIHGRTAPRPPLRKDTFMRGASGQSGVGVAL